MVVKLVGIGPVGDCLPECKASFWDEKIKLSNEALKDIQFWKQCFGQFNGWPIWPVSPNAAVITYSDASTTE